LSSLRLQSDTWDRLKAAMRERFISPTYQRDLRKKLQRLDQGDMSVQDYYAEFQKGMIRAGVHEEMEDKICHFYSGLHTKIQDIVDYKEYYTVNRLFQLAMLAKKELQRRQMIKMKTSFMPHSAPTTPSRTVSPSRARSSMTPLATRAPSMWSTPFATSPHATDPSNASVSLGVAAAKPSSLTVPTGRTSDIKCHCWHGIAHFQRDCPSKKSYIAIVDGGYVSAGDTEDDLALETNHAGDLVDNDDEHVFGNEHTTKYNKIYVMQLVLSANVDHSEKLQRHNLLQIFFIVKDCRIRIIIDGGNCNNLVSADFVTKNGLMTHAHTHPYYIQWLNNIGKAKVARTVCVHFSISTYHDYAN
jgi:hypothetical protein